MIGPDVVARFFKMTTNRKIPEAEDELEKIKAKLDRSKGDLGYLRALEGLVLTQKSGDKSLYLNRTNLDQDSVKELRREFLAHASNELHDEYDRGYFRALSDYVKTLDDLRIWDSAPSKPSEKYEDEIGKETGTTEA